MSYLDANETVAVMYPHELQDFLNEYCGEHVPLLVPEDTFNRCAKGLAFDEEDKPVIIYHRNWVVSAFMKLNGWDRESAEEWIDYNCCTPQCIFEDGTGEYDTNIDIKFKFTRCRTN
jgi:hypothetical protein